MAKIREDIVGGPSIVSTSKAVVDETFCPQINEFVPVNCRRRLEPTLTLFDVSTNAYWVVYKMEL